MKKIKIIDPISAKTERKTIEAFVNFQHVSTLMDIDGQAFLLVGGLAIETLEDFDELSKEFDAFFYRAGKGILKGAQESTKENNQP